MQIVITEPGKIRKDDQGSEMVHICTSVKSACRGTLIEKENEKVNLIFVPFSRLTEVQMCVKNVISNYWKELSCGERLG